MGELAPFNQPGPQAEDGIIMQAFQILQSRIKEKDAKIAELAPLAERAALCEGTGSAVDMTAAAGVIADKLSSLSGHVIKMGRNLLYDLLRDLGYIRPETRQAYQRFVDTGLFKNASKIIPNGNVEETVKVTPKGIQAIINRIVNEGIPKKIFGKKLLEA